MKKIIFPIIYLCFSSVGLAQNVYNHDSTTQQEMLSTIDPVGSAINFGDLSAKQFVENNLKKSVQYIDLIFYSAPHKHINTILQELEKLQKTYGFNVSLAKFPQEGINTINNQKEVHILKGPTIIAVSKNSKRTRLVNNLEEWEGINKDCNDLKTAITNATYELQKYDEDHKPL